MSDHLAFKVGFRMFIYLENLEEVYNKYNYYANLKVKWKGSGWYGCFGSSVKSAEDIISDHKAHIENVQKDIEIISKKIHSDIEYE